MEYCWGISKARFRAINGREVGQGTYGEKQAKFISNVELCLSNTPRTGVLRHERALKCARRARAYKLAYQKLGEVKMEKGDSTLCTYSEIEEKCLHYMNHTYKSHIDASRVDGKFIAGVIEA